jgi:4-hydroxybutyryl-CoA dehydratase/vinylacetyl-CoA-Delta-isomerase
MTSVSTLVEALHGAGSPQAQRIVMLRQADLPEKTRQAKKVIGIRDGDGESKGRG